MVRAGNLTGHPLASKILLEHLGQMRPVILWLIWSRKMQLSLFLEPNFPKEAIGNQLLSQELLLYRMSIQQHTRSEPHQKNYDNGPIVSLTVLREVMNPGVAGSRTLQADHTRRIPKVLRASRE